MSEVGSALIAATVVLISVFVPTAFIPGITGEFYRQFAITIAVSTTISLIVSLSLSPAMCALFLKPMKQMNGSETGASEGPKVLRDSASRSERLINFMKKNIPHYLTAPLRWFFSAFDWAFERSTNVYIAIVGRLVRFSAIGMLIYVGLLGLTYLGFTSVPTGFIPPQDQGYAIVSIELPPGASLARTGEVADEVRAIADKVPGVAHVVQIVGLNGATRAASSNAAALFVTFGPAAERAQAGQSMQSILRAMQMQTAAIDQARIIVIPPPPVPGIGTGGGFKLQIQDRSGAGLDTLEQVASGESGPRCRT